jgi:hypothetical protein
MLGALGVLLVASILAAVVAARIRQKDQRLEVVAEALRACGAEPMRIGSAVEGTVRGVAVTYELRDPGKNTPARTMCRVSFSGSAPPFEMDLRPQTPSEELHVQRGRAIDLVMGDPAFDDAYIIEAAPSDVARALLDQKARAELVALHPCRLTALSHELTWQKERCVDDALDVRRVVELCVSAAERLQSLPAELHEREMAQAFAHAGYRGPSPDVLRVAAGSAQEAGLAEIEEMRAVRDRRQVWQAKRVALVAAGVLLAWWVLKRCF